MGYDKYGYQESAYLPLPCGCRALIVCNSCCGKPGGCQDIEAHIERGRLCATIFSEYQCAKHTLNSKTTIHSVPWKFFAGDHVFENGVLVRSPTAVVHT